MATFIFDVAKKRMLQQAAAIESGQTYYRYTVRRRSWRTLWVKRSYRVKVPAVMVSLHTCSTDGQRPI